MIAGTEYLTSLSVILHRCGGALFPAYDRIAPWGEANSPSSVGKHSRLRHTSQYIYISWKAKGISEYMSIN